MAEQHHKTRSSSFDTPQRACLTLCHAVPILPEKPNYTTPASQPTEQQLQAAHDKLVRGQQQEAWQWQTLPEAVPANKLVTSALLCNKSFWQLLRFGNCSSSSTFCCKLQSQTYTAHCTAWQSVKLSVAVKMYRAAAAAALWLLLITTTACTSVAALALRQCICVQSACR